MRSDADALPLLLQVMAVAGAHDEARCVSLLDEAEATLTPGRPGAAHKARPDIEAAREATLAGEWVRVHRLAWAAMCGLTWAFPPDPSLCPPTPGPAPLAASGWGCVRCDGGWWGTVLFDLRCTYASPSRLRLDAMYAWRYATFMNTKARHQRVGNRDLAVAMQEKRRSNAASTHQDRRTRKNRGRAAQRRNAIGDFR